MSNIHEEEKPVCFMLAALILARALNTNSFATTDYLFRLNSAKTL